MTRRTNGLIRLALGVALAVVGTGELVWALTSTQAMFVADSTVTICKVTGVVLVVAGAVWAALGIVDLAKS